MAFNLLKQILGRNYRPVVDAGKAVAPVAAPLVQTFLASKGLPTTAEAALGQLAVKAASGASLTPELAAGLQSYVAAHLTSP